jgi:hypothetical protein
MIGNIEFLGYLQADHIRDGAVIDTRFSGPDKPRGAGFAQFEKSTLYRRIVNAMLGRPNIGNVIIRKPNGDLMNGQLGLVTSAGVNFMAAAFAGGTAISSFNFHDSGTGTQSQGTQTLNGGSISNATPQVVTTPSSHGLTTNDLVTIAGVTGDTTANGTWQIAVLSPTTFSLQNLAAGGAATVTSATYQRTNGAGDTVLVTQAGPTTRATGTQSTPGSVNVYKSVGTITYTSSLAILEWGIFSQAAQGGTLWDRRWLNTVGAPAVSQAASGTSLVAAPINVINGDSIQFSYSLTCNAGGS